MKKARPLFLVLCGLFAAGCASPPQGDIDSAKAALAAALKNPDIITYAPDALRAAQEKMDALDAEIAAQDHRSPLSRNYDKTKALAGEAAALARSAGDTAVTAKAQVAVEASALAEEVTGAIPVFESRIWAAKRVPRIKLDVIAPLQTLPDQTRATLADAQKDIAAGDYAAAKAKLGAARDQLSSSTETIKEETRIARAR